MDIPYTQSARPDTGLYNARLGVWLFLASEVMFFGGLFSAYVFLRTGASSWPHGSDLLNIRLALVNTVVLLTSSLTIFLSKSGIVEGSLRRYRAFMGLTIVLGCIFLAIKSLEWGAKLTHGVYPSESTFYAVYFTLTGLHALHLAGGILLAAYLLATSGRWWNTRRVRFEHRVEVAGYYWHFVDVIWVIIFLLMYVF